MTWGGGGGLPGSLETGPVAGAWVERLRVQGLGFRVQGLGLGFRVRVSGSGFRA